jgi:hypothetical protein
MASYNENLLPTTTGFDLGASSTRWDVFAQDLDIAGTFSIVGRMAIKNLEDIRFADQYTGTVVQQLDGAIADVVTGLVVAPSTMGAGTPTTLNSAQYLLDLRNGAFRIYCGNTSTPQLDVTSGGIAAQVYTGAGANPASAGLLRMNKSELIKFRNNANSADIAGLQMDSSNVVQVGDTAGAKVAGQFAIAGTLTGVTTQSMSGQLSSSLATGTAPFSITSTTVVPNLNVATLNGVTVSGAPTSGQVLAATSATTAGWSSSAGSAYKLENIQYTPTTFVSSAGGAYFTYSLPANELAVGQALRFTFTGTWTNTSVATRTYTFTLKAGATTLLSWTLAASNTSVTNLFMAKQILAICTAAGSSGTLEVQAIDPPGPLAGMTDPTSMSGTANTATIAFDTTTIQSLTLNVVQTNDATTATTGRQFMVERLG